MSSESTDGNLFDLWCSLCNFLKSPIKLTLLFAIPHGDFEDPVPHGDIGGASYAATGSIH